MEERQKQLLRRNRVALVERLKPSDLYDALLEKRLFSQDMIDEIKVRPRCCVPKYKFLFFSLCQHCNTSCYGCSAQAPGGIRPGSWS